MDEKLVLFGTYLLMATLGLMILGVVLLFLKKRKWGMRALLLALLIAGMSFLVGFSICSRKGIV